MCGTKQVTCQIWPVGSNLLTPALDNKLFNKKDGFRIFPVLLQTVNLQNKKHQSYRNNESEGIYIWGLIWTGNPISKLFSWIFS